MGTFHIDGSVPVAISACRPFSLSLSLFSLRHPLSLSAHFILTPSLSFSLKLTGGADAVGVAQEAAHQCRQALPRLGDYLGGLSFGGFADRAGIQRHAQHPTGRQRGGRGEGGEGRKGRGEEGEWCVCWRFCLVCFVYMC